MANNAAKIDNDCKADVRTSAFFFYRAILLRVSLIVPHRKKMANRMDVPANKFTQITHKTSGMKTIIIRVRVAGGEMAALQNKYAICRVYETLNKLQRKH